MMALSLETFILCVIGLLFHNVLSQTLSEDSDRFANYMKLYDKVYSSEEFNRRFLIWQQNVDSINQHNKEFSMGLHSYTMGINQFADLTNDEYRTMMLTYKSNRERSNRDKSNTQDVSSISTKPLPKSVDWKAEGYVTEVGNQGLNCGSCWAFTATGALEGQHKKKTGVLVDLSERNLMDCSTKQGNLGCQGGFVDSAFRYVIENDGIDTEQSYPYNRTTPGGPRCLYRKADRGATCTCYVDLPTGNETALQEAVAFVGPIAVAVDPAHKGFQLYKTGVYDDNACSPMDASHGLVIVGYGVENWKEYYNCKNSWGTTWGDQGYIKMIRNKNNQCGIATVASYPTM